MASLPNEILVNILERMTTDNIHEKLQHAGLGDFHGVIAGSFVLQCALNETYHGSDIDIWLPKFTGTLPEYLNLIPWFRQQIQAGIMTMTTRSEHGNLVYVICASRKNAKILNDHLSWGKSARITPDGIELCPNADLDIDHLLIKVIKYQFNDSWELESATSFITESEILASTKFIVATRVEKIRSTTSADVKQFVTDNFDSDLCSIWYDGRRLSPLFANLFQRLYCKNMCMSFTWKREGKNLHQVYNKLHRTNKRYMIKPVSHPEGGEMPETAFDRVDREAIRVKKYIDRGFLVEASSVINPNIKIIATKLNVDEMIMNFMES
jgi:hypothetical protein